MGWILVAVLTQMAAVNGLRPLISYRAIELGASTGQIGFIAGAYAAFSFFLAIPIGRRVDRTSEAPFIIVGAALVAVATLAVERIDTIVGLGVAQAGLGVGQLVGIMGLQALVANAGDALGRSARFGAFTSVASVGQMVGPALAGWLAGDGPNVGRSAFLGMALLALLSLVGSLPLWSRRRVRDDAPSSLREAGGGSSLWAMLALPGMSTAMWASATTLASIDVLIAYLPLYGQRYGIPAATVGLLLSARAAGSTVVRVAMVPLLRGVGSRPLLSLSLGTTAITLGVLPLVPAWPTWALVALLAVAGMGLGLSQPITMSWVAARAPEEQRATALGMRISGNRLGQLMLPAAVGAFAGPSGVVAVLVSIGAVLASSALLVSRYAVDEADGDGSVPLRT